jgi:hypothetical protein
MDRMEVKLLVDELKQKEIGYNHQDIEKYFNNLPYKLDEDSWLIILEELAEDKGIFRWYHFICKKLPLIARADSRFINLISKIVKKVKKDLASGCLWDAFAEIGRQKPSLGLEIFTELTSKDDDLKLWAGAFLGGVAMAEPRLVSEKILREYHCSHPCVKATFIYALMTAGSSMRNTEIQHKIVDIVTGAFEESVSVLRGAAISYCIRFFEEHPQEFKNLLYNVAAGEKVDDKSLLLNNLIRNKIPDDEFEFEMIHMCLKEEDRNIASLIPQVLFAYNRAARSPERALEIMRVMLTKDIHHRQQAMVIAELIQGSDPVKCFSIIESWMEEESNSTIAAEIPELLIKIFSKDIYFLLNLLEKWTERGKPYLEVCLNTLRIILEMVYNNKEISNDSLIRRIFTILNTVAKTKGCDVDKIIKEEGGDKLFAAFRVIEELETEIPQLDYNKIYKNLQSFPEILNLLSMSWFKEKERENNKTHPLLVLLFETDPDINKFKSLRNLTNPLTKEIMLLKYFYPYAILRHIEEMLVLIKGHRQIPKHIERGFKNEEQFWQTLSELEVAYLFAKRCNFEFQPEVGGKRLDLRLLINGNELLFEVITPQMYKPLRYVSRFVGLKNRVKGKITEKIESQIRSIVNVISCPLILVIDMSLSELTYDDIIDAFEGSLSFEIYVNKQTHRFVGCRVVRIDDSLSHHRPESKIISAVIGYKRKVTEEGKVRLEGIFYRNPQALNPLNDVTYDKLAGELRKNNFFLINDINHTKSTVE